jgi:hypothetical protein
LQSSNKMSGAASEEHLPRPRWLRRWLRNTKPGKSADSAGLGRLVHNHSFSFANPTCTYRSNAFPWRLSTRSAEAFYIPLPSLIGVPRYKRKLTAAVCCLIHVNCFTLEGILPWTADLSRLAASTLVFLGYSASYYTKH